MGPAQLPCIANSPLQTATFSEWLAIYGQDRQKTGREWHNEGDPFWKLHNLLPTAESFQCLVPFFQAIYVFNCV